MSATAEAVACTHGTIGADPNVVVFHDCHHVYKRGDRQLASVSSVIREMWPFKKSFEGADPAVLEHARERGIRVDAYLTEYINTGRVAIRASDFTDGEMQQEVTARTRAACEWWDRNGLAGAVGQIILADNSVAGTADIVDVECGFIADLKNVSALDNTYFLQLGAYGDLYESQFHRPAALGALIHVTQPKGKPARVECVEVDIQECVRDWRILRAAWEMAHRRAKL